MFIFKQHHYYVYIVTNPNREVLYTGVTNDLPQRLAEHWVHRGNLKTFAGKYYCYNLIYYEYFPYIKNAIRREKEIKGWTRKKKTDLIDSINPKWAFMNEEVCNGWPPKTVLKEISNKV